MDRATSPPFPVLDGGLEVDVAVVGGGIVGITAALLLKDAGRRVAVIESRRVGQQVTGGSTAKVTAQHGLIYADLVRRFGTEGARSYAAANLTGFERIAALVEAHGIDCGFERRAAYCYTLDSSALQRLEAEAEAAAGAGLPARMVREVPLPYPVAGAVRFDNQAQFDPCAYTAALAATIPGDGSAVFEHTRVLDADDSGRVETDRGAVSAEAVIVATNLPILDRGGFFGKAFPRSHVALAAPIAEAEAPDGMFLCADAPTHSLRTARIGGRLHLIAAGDGFKTGQGGDLLVRHRDLEAFVRSRFQIEPVAWRWSNQDYDSMDGVPYVGRLTARSKRLLVATGFGAWGITNGTAAAMILADLVLGRPNPWAAFFDSTRINPGRSARKFMTENIDVAKHFVVDHLRSKRAVSIDDLAPGEAAIVSGGDGRMAAYRDPEGRISAVSASCTHMGCMLAWNNADRSWDCPCHGSRFAPDGTVLHGPAIRNLDRKR